MMRSPANAIAGSPDEQKRFTVTADASTGTPARRLAMRATFNPCSASGIAHPRITSSLSPAARPRTPPPFHPLLGLRHRTPEDHVVDVASREAGRTAQHVLDDGRGHLVGP